MGKLLQSLIIFLSIIIFSGCQSENLKIYSSDKYSFKYPSTYLIKEANEFFPALTVKGNKGRIEIFNKNDFQDPLSLALGERAHDYSSSGLEEFEAEYVPKNKYKKGEFGIWLFYKENDKTTKKELQDIFKSIKIN